MRSPVVRTLIALATFLVVWLVIGPARAETASSLAAKAPLCDPRGAITFAPPPQMQEVEVTLDTGMTFDDCMGASRGETHRAAPGRAPAPLDAFSASNDALGHAGGVVTLARALRELLPAPDASTPCVRPGYRSTVDRPPRA